MRLCTLLYIYMSRVSEILGIDEGLGSAFTVQFPETNYFDVYQSCF